MGDPERARATLVESCSMLEEMHNWTHFVSQASALADVLCALGEDDAARQRLRAAEVHLRRDDTFARLDLGAVRGKLLARAGDDDDAKTVASETVALAETTDGLNQHAAALLALAEVHELAGRDDEAGDAVVRARTLYAAKENVAASALLETGAATRGHDIV
jgi:ATP/maltotriose-dependent transcriptional regulator MalT